MADGAGEAASGTMFSIERAEFDRLQMQLIDLRTTNYQLKEQNSKNSAELSRLQEVVQSQARELEKANRSIQRSKKAKEFSTLVEENDGLQRKIESQEEEFRLQNKTLMEELGRVCDEKEQLTSELDKLKRRVAGGSSEGGVASASGEELTHLKAQNAALQKSLQALQEKIKDSSNSEPGTEDQEQQSSAATNDKVLELEVRLATEEEEKKLLQSRLEEVREDARQQQEQLRNELEKWTDKAKKKQDSLVQLQEEKERQFTENRAAFEKMVRSKDHEIHSLQSKVTTLTKDLDNKNKATTVSEEVSRQLESLSTEKEELTLKCTSLATDKEALVNRHEELQSLLDELGKELQQAKAQVGEERKNVYDLQTQLEEAKLSQETLADQVVKTNEEKYGLTEKLEAANKLAEKRKAILDEMSIKGQESATEQQKKMDELEERYKDETAKLEEELQKEQSRVWKLTEANEELPELRKRVKGLEEERGELQARLGELEQSSQQEREEHERTVEEMKQSHETATTEAKLSQETLADQVVKTNEEKYGLTEKLEAANKSLESELSSCRHELEESQSKMEELERSLDDKQEAVRVVEKKSQNMMKDLKRQLQQMQKREEKLQEQLTALRGGAVLDSSGMAPVREISYDSKHSRDSSLSSLRGLIRSGTENSVDTGTSPGASLTSPSSALGTPATATMQSLGSASTPGAGVASVSEETQELLARVAELQQEKWNLEEKVQHLESTGSALAEDVIQKSEIIKTYFMETKADHLPSQSKKSTVGNMVDKMSPMKLMPWTKHQKEETLEEINRKMQRALEEALMKNISLQENMSMLTTELEKYTQQEKERTPKEGASGSSETSQDQKQP